VLQQLLDTFIKSVHLLQSTKIHNYIKSINSFENAPSVKSI